jgi:DNA-binding NarL/FixJ family response regulator
VGEAASGEETSEVIQNIDTDVLITDLNMKAMNGIQLTEQIQKILPELRVIIWSSSTERVYISKAREAGAAGYIDKTSGVDTLLNAIREITRDDFGGFCTK